MLSRAQENEMKIYWKKLIWNYTIRYWRNLIYFRKSAFWKSRNHCDKQIWNSTQWAACEKAMASLLPKLDDVIRRITAKDNAITTVASISVDQKMYKGGKVIAIKKTT